MRDALANIRLAFVEIKGRGARPPADGSTAPDAACGRRRRKRPSGRVDDPAVAHDDALGAQQRGLPGRRVGASAPVAAHDPPPRQRRRRCVASSAPTARARPGKPASSATSP